MRRSVEGRVLELGSKAGRKELEREWKELRRGWYVGGESFLEKLEERIAGVMTGRRRESFSGAAKTRHDEAGAEEALEQGMKVLGLKEKDLKTFRPGAREKVALGWWLRRETTVSLRWVSERLEMGHYSRVSQAVNRMQRKPGRQLEKLKRKLTNELTKRNQADVNQMS